MSLSPRSAHFDLNAAPLSVRDVTLAVQDLVGMATFYETLLGLKRFGESNAEIILGADTPFLHLVHRPDAAPKDPRAPGLFHIAFLMPTQADLAAWLHHLAELNVPLLGASDHNVSEAIYLTDPEGNGIEVYADRPMSQWHDATGTLNMPSDPLDLSRFAQAPAWTGAPAALRIGHVHLQTTDIPAAEAFWRDLGFEVMARYPGGSFFGSGGYHHQIAANIWRSRSAARPEGPVTGLTDITLSIAPEADIQPTRQIAPSGVTVTLTPS